MKIYKILAFGMIMACPAFSAAKESGTAAKHQSIGVHAVPANNSAALATKDVLSEPELSKLRPKALLGDAEAAKRVYLHFNVLSASSESQEEPSRWLVIAAENGSVDAILMYSLQLASTGHADDCLRAKYWIGRARALAPSRKFEDAVCIKEL
jgi:hypothetical protein